MTYATIISCLMGKFKKNKMKKQFVFQISIDESVFHQMVTVAQDVSTVYLRNIKARFSSKSTGVVSTKNSPMPKFYYFFLGNVVAF